jgi:signal peptide peptidase SppA
MTQTQTTPTLIQTALRPGPWAMNKPTLQQLPAQLALRLSNLRMSADEIQAAIVAGAGRSIGQIAGNVGIIPIQNCITYKYDFWTYILDGTATEQIRPAFRQMLADPAISTIVFDVDSPGGEVADVPELADEIFAARGKKKMIAVCNPLMCSAALWLASASDEIVQMPSGHVGSVGCYTMHEDMSALLERIGIKITFIQHGEHKTEGNFYEPLSEDAESDLQASVNFFGSWFEKALAKYRGKTVAEIRETFGQGLVFRAQEAKRVGMIDRIATIGEVLDKLSAKRVGQVRPAAAAAPPVPAAAAEPPVPAVAAAEDEDGIEPDDDGQCPDGYENRGGRCHLKGEDTDEEASAAAARTKATKAAKDQIAVTLALTEAAGR